MALYSTEADRYLIGEDGRAFFSNSGDQVDVENGNEMIRGRDTLLHSGDDTYFGTSFDSVGWDNIASGNRGDDSLNGSWLAPSRDLFRGGKDDDFLNGGVGGSDFLHGSRGNDWIQGSAASSILRGGRGEDIITGGRSRDLLVGALGKDHLMGNGGSDFFMLRTDVTYDGYSNLVSNSVEADRILDFNAAEDYVIIPGVNSHNDVRFDVEGNDTVVKVWNGQDELIAGVLEGIAVGAFDPGITDARVIVGGLADQINSETGNVDEFLNSPNMLYEFGF